MKRFALKRLTALVLAFIMTLSLCPVTALAESSTVAGEQICVAEEIFVTEEETDESTFLEKEEKTLISSEEEDSITQKVDSEYVVEPTATSLPIANSVVSAVQAQWGVADGASVPVEWAGSGDLDAAINYAKGLENCVAYIQLLSDVKTSAPLYFLESRTAILDLNGKTIDRGLTEETSEGYVIKVDGNLTLCDNSVNAATAPGEITGGFNSGNGGGVYVGTGGEFVMTGGSITGNSAACDTEGSGGHGGGVYVDSATFTMKSGTISDNTAEFNGGGICILAGNLAIEDGIITENTAIKNSGGGVCFANEYENEEACSFVLSGGTISKNSAKNFGGGVSIHKPSTFTMNGGLVTENSCDSLGGGVYSEADCSIEMTAGTISKNTAGDGGGVEVMFGTFTMSGGSIVENTASDWGGGVDVYEGSFTMNAGEITGNNAKQGGGVAVWNNLEGEAEANPEFSVSGGTISGNTATNAGGGVYFYDGTFNVSGTPDISENTGSNVYLRADKTITVGALYSGTSIGVTMADGSGTFSSGGASYASKRYFTSDVVDYAVIADGSNLKLVEQLSVSFNANGGSGTMENQAVTSGVATALNANTFTCENYYFNGWNTKADGTGTTYADKASITVTSAITLYAQWLPAQARWGLATGENNDGVPTSWTNGPLSNAMTYANDLYSGTAYIQLLSDVNTNAMGALVFNSGKTTILDLNGHDIDRGLTEETDYGYVIKVNGNLTLCDTSSDDVTKQGKITGGYNSGSGGGVYANGDFTMSGGSVTDNTAYLGGGVYIYNNSTFTLKDGTISDNTAKTDGGGVYGDYWSEGSVFTMHGGSISKNTAGNGGGVFTEGTFTMNSGVISENTASSGGGGVCAYSCTFTMNGGTISKNTSGVYYGGGGVSVNDHSEFIMTDGTISGNTATKGSGGGVCVNSSTLILSGGTISGNNAKKAGGVYLSSNTTTFMKISGTPVISGNVINGTLNSATGLYEQGESGTISNLDGYYGNATVVGALNDSALIGVTSDPTPTNDTPFTIATGSGYTLTASDAAKFVGDDGSFGALNSTNNTVELKLAKAILDGAGVVAPGSEVTLLLNVSGTGIAGAEGTLDYDSDTLEFVSCKNVAADWDMGCYGNKYVMTCDDDPVTSETGILAVTFRVKDTVPVDAKLNVALKNTTLTDGVNDFDIGTVAWSGTVDMVSANATLTGNSIISAGSEVTLTMALSGDSITSAEMMLDYDSGVLEYVSYRALHNEWSVTKDGEKFTLSGEDRPISAATELLAVTFLVKRNVPAGAMLSAAFTDIVISDGVTSKNAGTAYWRASVNGTMEAQWGLATGSNNDQKPTTWVGSGTLMDAVYYANELTEGVSYIQLVDDVVDTTAPLEFARGKTAVLDLNGHDIDRGLTKPTYDGNVITVKGNLTLCDTSATATGKITGGNIKGDYSSESSGGGVIVNENGAFTMNSGNISNNTAYADGGGVIVNYNGAFTMNGGTVSGNAAHYGGGVCAYHTFTMNGGTISGNAAYNGGGVYASRTFTMNGGTVSGNVADYSGGGVYAYNTFTMNDGKISMNSAKNSGGGVYGNLAMRGGTISGNNAENGGGVYGQNTVKMSGGTITGNTAVREYDSYGYYNGGYGGGVYCSNLQVWGTPVITDNVSNGTFNPTTGCYESGSKSNVYLYGSSGNPITVVDKLKDGAKIGISGKLGYNETSRVVVTGIDTAPTYVLTADDAAKFTSDNEMILEYKSANNSLILKNSPEPEVDPKLEVTSGSLNLFEDSTLIVPIDWDYTMVSAEFVDWQTRNAFDLTMLGNDMLEITPKVEKPEYMTWAEWSESMAGTYKSAIRVEFITGTTYTTPQQLSITLTATAPKVTAGAVKFNSFLAGDTQPLALSVGDAVVESVAVDSSKENPAWITVNDDQTLTLINEELVNKKGSGKLNLEVWLEGWRVPAEAVVSVSAAYSAPKLKLNKSSVNLVGKAQYQEPVELALLSGDKNFDINKVTNLNVDNDAYVVVYLGGGLFTLDTVEDITGGKINLIAEIDGKPNQTITVPLTVKVVMPTLKANPAKVTLNTAKGYDEGDRDEKAIAFSGDVPESWYSDVTWEITPPKNASADMITVVNNGDGTVTFYANEDIVDGSYKVNVTVGAAKPVAITVTAKATLPKLKLNKSSITLNTAMGDNADVQTVTVTDSDVNYDFVLLQEEVTAPDGISAVVGENNTIAVSALMETANGSYKVEIEHKMPGGQGVKSTLTVKVAAKLPTLKPDNKTLSLDKIHGIGTVNVAGIENYSVGELVAEPTVDGITVEMIDRDSFTVKIDETLDKKGGKINVYYKLSDAVQTKPVAITVKPVTAIAVTAAVKGNMDVTRPAFDAPDAKLTANFTFKYTGWYPGEYGDMAYEPALVWEVYAMSGKNKIVGHEAYDFVTGKGSLVASSDDNNGGWFCDVDDTDYGVALALNTDENSAWKNGAVNPKYTYTVETKLVFADGTEAVCKSVKLTVKQGSVKFAADTKAVTVAKQQDAESVTFAINGTDKDKLLVADIAKVEVAASKNPRAFTVIESGDGYAIKVVNPAIAKSGTVKLNIWLEGNYVNGCEEILDTKSTYYRKPNATVSLKVTVQ